MFHSTQTRPSDFPKSCPTLSLGFSRFASTKQPFVTSGSRPQAVLHGTLENLVTEHLEWQVSAAKSEPHSGSIWSSAAIRQRRLERHLPLEPCPLKGVVSYPTGAQADRVADGRGMRSSADCSTGTQHHSSRVHDLPQLDSRG